MPGFLSRLVEDAAAQGRRSERKPAWHIGS